MIIPIVQTFKMRQRRRVENTKKDLRSLNTVEPEVKAML